jgi:hypothetical protein
LKDIDPETKTVNFNQEIIEEMLTSNDLFLVRNFIKNRNLMSCLTGKEISILAEKFPHLHSSFDISTIVEEFIFSSQKKLSCLICKKEFLSPFEVIHNLECKGEVYHPKNILKNERGNCLHEGCSKKVLKGDMSCCHKPNSPGCVQGEGRHMIVFVD